MPLPKKDYYDLPTIADLWQTDLKDVQHYAETGKLRCSVWISQTEIEMGVFSKQANGKKIFEAQDNVYIQGFVGVLPEDCRKLFRNKKANTTIFVSLKRPNCYLHIAEEEKIKITIKPKDLVVLANDRENFEQTNGLYPTNQTEAEIIGSHEENADFNSARFSHSADFQTVTLDDEVFRFGMVQAKIISLLYEAHKSDEEWVHGKILLYESGSRSERLKNIFQSKSNWRKLIKSDGRGYYALNL